MCFFLLASFRSNNIFPENLEVLKHNCLEKKPATLQPQRCRSFEILCPLQLPGSDILIEEMSSS